MRPSTGYLSLSLARWATGLSGLVPLTKLVFEGDSITVSANSYAEQWKTANPSVPCVNCAVGGSGIATMVSRLSTTMANSPSHLTILIGANDLMSGTEAAFTSALASYIGSARAYNPSLVVGVCGVLPIDESASANTGKTGFNARRDSVNATLRSWVGGTINFYIPLGDHPDMTPATAADASYSADGLHWTGLGQAPQAQVYADVMDAIHNAATVTSPTTITIAPQSNVALSTAVTGRGRITGMKIGNVATATITSGPGDFARGNGSFASTSRNFVNGDVLVARETSSGSTNTALSTVYAVGSRSATFTVTTIAASPDSFSSIASQQASTGFTGAAHTFSVVFPAGLPVLGIVKDSTSLVQGDVLINGVAATLVREDIGRSMWVGSQVLSAGTYTVSVQSGGAQHITTIYPGCIANAVAGVSSSSYRAFAAANDGTAYVGTGAITVPSGGISLAFVGSSVAAAVITLGNQGGSNYAAGTNYGDGFHWYTHTASGTPQITTDTFDPNALGFIAASVGQ